MFTLLFSALCAWVAFFLPAFHTFKVLNAIPSPDEQELKRIARYWCCVGCFVGVEYLAEWLVSWLPFYWELKTVFLLFLALPQIQGSTFIYTTYLQPFFSQNEKQIDDGIVSMQAGIVSFVKSKFFMIWELLWSVINKTPTPGQVPSSTSGQSSAAPPVSLQTVLGLFQTYAPAIINALQPAEPPTSSASVSSSAVSSAAVTPNPDRPAPSFPEPQHVQ